MFYKVNEYGGEVESKKGRKSTPWKTTKMEYDKNGTRPKWNTTKIEDNQNERESKLKMTKWKTTKIMCQSYKI